VRRQITAQKRSRYGQRSTEHLYVGGRSYIVLYFAREPMDEDGFPDMQSVTYPTPDAAVADAREQLQSEGRVRKRKLALVDGGEGRWYLMDDEQITWAKIIEVRPI